MLKVPKVSLAQLNLSPSLLFEEGEDTGETTQIFGNQSSSSFYIVQREAELTALLTSLNLLNNWICSPNPLGCNFVIYNCPHTRTEDKCMYRYYKKSDWNQSRVLCVQVRMRYCNCCSEARALTLTSPRGKVTGIFLPG